jgi:hypothetical protein
VNTRRPEAVLQRGRPMLVEFWDFARPNSLRTLPYVKAGHRLYSPSGLRVIGVHSPGFQISRDEQAVRDAVARLGIDYPVLIDSDLLLWQDYENLGWPARYLFDGRARLLEYHYGEGGYLETEQAIQELLGVGGPTIAPLRPEDAPGATLVAQSADEPGPYCGPYAAGGVWAVLDGSGTLSASDSALGLRAGVSVGHPGAFPLFEHQRHAEGVLELEMDAGVHCHAICFTPGVR